MFNRNYIQKRYPNYKQMLHVRAEILNAMALFDWVIVEEFVR